MVLFVVHEQAHEYGAGAMEHLRDGGSPPERIKLGVYTPLAVATRLRDLYAGGDCFTAPCPEALCVYHRWADDGTGTVCLQLRPPPKDDTDYDSDADFSELTLSIQTQEVGVPPPLDKRPSCWYALEAAVRPPPPPSPPLSPQAAAAALAEANATEALAWAEYVREPRKLDRVVNKRERGSLNGSRRRTQTRERGAAAAAPQRVLCRALVQRRSACFVARVTGTRSSQPHTQ